MLYLCKNYQEFNGQPKKCIKIGYTKEINSREKIYRTSAGIRGYTRIGNREGDRLLENMFHVRYKNSLLINSDTKRPSEWCRWDQKIIDSFFTDTLETLGEFLWMNKERYLIPFIKNKGKARNVYNYLLNKTINELGFDIKLDLKTKEKLIELTKVQLDYILTNIEYIDYDATYQDKIKSFINMLEIDSLLIKKKRGVITTAL